MDHSQALFTFDIVVLRPNENLKVGEGQGRVGKG